MLLRWTFCSSFWLLSASLFFSGIFPRLSATPAGLASEASGVQWKQSMGVETSLLLLAWIAILLLAFGLSGLLRQVRALSTQVRGPEARLGPEVGTFAPRSEALGLVPGNPALLIFVQDVCPTCDAVLERLTAIQGDDAGDLSIMAVFRGSTNGFGSTRVKTVANQDELFDQFHIPVTPFGVLLDRDGRIAEARPLGSLALFEQLLVDAKARGS
jgi:hypothetical protein